MKKYLFWLFLVMLWLPCFSQNAFYDAKRVIRLKNELVTGIYEQQTIDSVLAILLKYKETEDQPVKSEGQMTIANIRDRYKESATGVQEVISVILSSQIANRESIKAAINRMPKGRTKPYVEEVQAMLTDISLYEKHLTNRIAYTKDSTLRLLPPEAGIKKLKLFRNILNADDFYNPDTISNERIKAEINILNDSIKNTFINKLQTSIPITYTETYNSPTAFLIRSNVERASDNAKILIEQVTSSKMEIPSQSEMIDAMAIYLANRVKLELTLTFFENLKKVMKDDAALFSLFPNTLQTLSSYPSYEAPNFGAKWKYAFAEDFVTIPEKIAEDKYHYFSQRFDGKQEVYIKFLKQAAQLAGAYKQNRNIIDVVEYLKLNVVEKNSVFGAYVEIFSLINNELYSTGKRDYWVSYTEFLRMSDEEFDIMLSLLTNRYPSIMSKLNTGSNTDQLTVKELKNWLANIMFVINQFQQAQHDLHEFHKDETRAGSYWSFASNLFEKITTEYESGRANAIKKHVLRLESGEYENIKTYVNIFRRFTSLYSGIQEKNYPLVLQQTVELIKELRQEKAFGSGKFANIFLKADEKLQDGNFSFLNNKKRQITTGRTFENFNKDALEWTELVRKYNAASPEAQRDIIIKLNEYQESLNQIVSENQELKKVLSSYYLSNRDSFYLKLRNNFPKLQKEVTEKSYAKFISALTFVTEVAGTNDSKELSQVIASYAAPPGSYRIKRSSINSWDVSAYVGLTAGFENKKFQPDNANFAYGLAAPIGISYSWGTPTKTAAPFEQAVKNEYLNGNAWTVSLSLIDIGAVVRYRLEGESNPSEKNANGLPYKISFAQVVAPSLHVHRGIKNTPLTFFLGLQYVPQLRNFQQERTADVRDYQGVFQLQGGVAFDLPLFHITKK